MHYKLCHAHKHLFCMHIVFTKYLYCHITKLGYFIGTLSIPRPLITASRCHIKSFIYSHI